MKFSVSSSALLSLLATTGKVISNKNTLPILDYFLMELNGNELKVTTSDLETTLIGSITVDSVESEGTIAAPAKLMLDSLKEFSELPLTIDVNDKNWEITINWKSGSLSIPGASAVSYPAVPQLSAEKKELRLDVDMLVNGINKTIFATADDELRPVMNGIYINLAPGALTFVGTDAHKLVKYESEAENEVGASFILPKKPANLLKSVLLKEDDAIEVDPALGWAGTRWSHARDYTMHAISALTCGTFSFLLMQTAGVAALPGLVIAAIAIGAAAGLAPQIGSAISAVGFLVLMANATMQAQGILSMLPVAVIFAAAMSGWWIAWGRTEAAASAALTCALALGCLTGNTFLAAGVAAGVASFWLGPASAAAATGMGALFARLATVALSAGGVLGLGNVAAALEDPLLWAAFALVATTAAASSALLNAHAKRADQGSNLAAIAAIAVTGIGCAAASCLAHHMEIASLAAAVAAKAAVAGTLSSIIVGICLYLLGYQRTYTESDLS